MTTRTKEQIEHAITRWAFYIIAGGVVCYVTGCLLTLPDIQIPQAPDTPPVVATTTTTTIPPAPPADLSGELIDPPGFTEASVAAAAQFEECGMEANYGMVLRCMVWRGKAGSWWILTTPFPGHVTRTATGFACPDFVFQGGLYHCRGWASDEPQNRDANPPMVSTGPNGSTKYPLWEVRAAK